MPQNFQTILTGQHPLFKVPSTADAQRYPGMPNSQDVLLDENDPDVAYFRNIDSNGFVTVERRRCIIEPELTPQQINDNRYISREEFSSFINEFQSFRKEIFDYVRNNNATTERSNGNAADSAAYATAQKYNDRSQKQSKQDGYVSTVILTEPTNQSGSTAG